MGITPRKPRHGALDAVLGDRIRSRRRELRLSQTALGGRLGVTFQQIQKYENGTNRVSAVMLVRLAAALELPTGDLLEAAKAPSNDAADTASDAERLLAAFQQISSPEMRTAVLTLVIGLAQR